MHKSVLLKEVIEYLNPQPGDNFIDGTLGGGGHALEIFKKTAPSGKVLGIDLDKEAILNLKQVIESLGGEGLKPDSGSTSHKTEPRLDRSGIELAPFKIKDRLVLAQGNFADIESIAEIRNFKNIKGVLLDLGLSSLQLENSGRGFSFLRDEPLDMRFDRDCDLTAEMIISSWPLEELCRIFKEYGEEKNFKKIARAIITARRDKRILTTGDLTKIVKRTVALNTVKTLARIFQALRIAVNGELENIERGLKGAWNVLDREGKLAVISFHSLEDRLVKNFFREMVKSGEGKILTPKPISAGLSEIKNNSSARSAKLRVIVKIKE